AEGDTSEGTEAEPDNPYVRSPFAKPKRPTQIYFNIGDIRGTWRPNLHKLEKGKTIVDTQLEKEWSKGWRKKEWEWVHKNDPPYPLCWPKQILVEPSSRRTSKRAEEDTSEGTKAEPDNSYIRSPFAKPEWPMQICFNIE
nr:hypothetical protein [Tanacetum cinerariifolium]